MTEPEPQHGGEILPPLGSHRTTGDQTELFYTETGWIDVQVMTDALMRLPLPERFACIEYLNTLQDAPELVGNRLPGMLLRELGLDRS